MGVGLYNTFEDRARPPANTLIYVLSAVHLRLLPHGRVGSVLCMHITHNFRVCLLSGLQPWARHLFEEADKCLIATGGIGNQKAAAEELINNYLAKSSESTRYYGVCTRRVARNKP